MDKRMWCVAAILLSGVGLVGCSKSKSSDSGTGGTGGGTPDTATSTAGTATGIGNGGTGAIVKNVECDDACATEPKTCFRCAATDTTMGLGMIVGGGAGGRPAGGFAIPAFAATCCADPSKKLCGSMSSGGMCMAAPEIAPKCPSTLGAGCCAGDNLCGIDASLFGMGCVEIGAIKRMFGMLLMGRGGMAGGFAFPDPAYCDTGEPVPQPDAGAAGSSGGGGTGAGGASGSGNGEDAGI